MKKKTAQAHDVSPKSPCHPVARQNRQALVDRTKRDDRKPKADSTSAARVRSIRLDQIQMSDATQMRVSINPAMLADYIERMRANAEFPPIRVVQDGQDFWLADGHYRVHAMRKLKRTTTRALVSPGTRRDAILLACGANADHGLRRTRADVRKAISVLLQDPEWSQRSDNWIAETVGCDHKTIAKVKQDLGIPECYLRKASDGRLINTAQIGKRGSSQPIPESAGHSANHADTVPAGSKMQAWKLFDESIADEVPTVLCPHCQQAMPEAWLRKTLAGGAK